MKRPYVVCHMMATVDGRIKTERWSLTPKAEAQYEAVHALHKADAWLCGRETFQGDFLEQAKPAHFPRKGQVPPGDFIGPKRLKGTAYALAVDASGALRWDSNDMRGDRLVVLTTRKAPAGYLADLREKGISYFIGGDRRIAFGPALSAVQRAFGIKKIMLEGGGTLNGSLLAQEVIDELSLLVCPYADGGKECPTLFDADLSSLGRNASALKLIGLRRRPGGVLWLRYRFVD